MGAWRCGNGQGNKVSAELKIDWLDVGSANILSSIVHHNIMRVSIHNREMILSILGDDYSINWDCILVLLLDSNGPPLIGGSVAL